MKKFLITCYVVLGGLTAFAADVPQVNIAQVQRAILQITENTNGYPTLEEIQQIAQNHKGDLNSLAKELLDAAKPHDMQYPYDEPYHDVQSIWYDGSTFLIVSLDHANNLHAEVYGPNLKSYVPNYNRVGIYRGNIGIELPELPSGSEGMNAKQVMNIVKTRVPQGMTLIASLDEFPAYDLEKVLEIANKRFFGDPLLPLAAELVEGLDRINPPHPIHSIWYKDGTLMVAKFQYTKYCQISFYGAKRGTIKVELPGTVYPDEGDLMLAIVASLLPEEVFLVALAGL